MYCYGWNFLEGKFEFDFEFLGVFLECVVMFNVSFLIFDRLVEIGCDLCVFVYWFVDLSLSNDFGFLN